MNDTKEKIDRWKQFNLIVDSERLEIKEKGLLIILFRFINYKTNYANPSRALLKKLTGISDNRTLDKIIDSLIGKGFLKRESGKGIRSKYFIKVGAEITPQKEKKNKTKENNIETSSKTKKDSDKELRYKEIFEYWNSKNIKKHRTITSDIKNGIDKTLKDYSVEEIKEAIDHYSIMFKDSTYEWCKYVWTLQEFLLRSDKDRLRQLPQFLEEGSKWERYLKKKKENQITPFVPKATMDWDG